MLKWGWELRGILQSKDEYMNLLVRNRLKQLTNAEEVVNGESKGELGEILIRCNNILYIRESN
jgi:small nuclear ribonucleoprotein F